MQEAVPNAFTLIELLVVISIMAIVAIMAVANYRSFGEGQILPNTALDLNSTLRTAQTNATTALQCSGSPLYRWRVAIYKYSGKINVSLDCVYGNIVSYAVDIIKTEVWPQNITVERIYDNGGCDNDLAGDLPNYYVYFKFQPLSGYVTMESKTAAFLQNCTGSKATIQLKNTTNGELKYVNIEQKGGIYVN